MAETVTISLRMYAHLLEIESEATTLALKAARHAETGWGKRIKLGAVRPLATLVGVTIKPVEGERP